MVSDAVSEEAFPATWRPAARDRIFPMRLAIHDPRRRCVVSSSPPLEDSNHGIVIVVGDAVEVWRELKGTLGTHLNFLQLVGDRNRMTDLSKASNVVHNL